MEQMTGRDMRFAEWLALRFAEKKIRKATLARKLRVDGALPDKWLKGIAHPSAFSRERLAEYFDVDRAEIDALIPERATRAAPTNGASEPTAIPWEHRVVRVEDDFAIVAVYFDRTHPPSAEDIRQSIEKSVENLQRDTPDILRRDSQGERRKGGGG